MNNTYNRWIRVFILYNGCSHSEYVFEFKTHCCFSMKFWRNWWHLPLNPGSYPVSYGTKAFMCSSPTFSYFQCELANLIPIKKRKQIINNQKITFLIDLMKYSEKVIFIKFSQFCGPSRLWQKQSETVFLDWCRVWLSKKTLKWIFGI